MMRLKERLNANCAGFDFSGSLVVSQDYAAGGGGTVGEVKCCWDGAVPKNIHCQFNNLLKSERKDARGTVLNQTHFFLLVHQCHLTWNTIEASTIVMRKRLSRLDFLKYVK